jgi:CRP-like cAMP-binding protein
MDPQDDGLEIFAEVDGVEVIQRTPIFAKLGYEETARLARIMHIERFSKGKVVVEQDSLGDALYIVREGKVAIYRQDSAGDRELLNHLGPGELFGEMSLVDDLLVSADVEVASESAELVVIPRGEFTQLLASDAGLAAKIYKSFCRNLSDRLRKANARLAEQEHELRRH